MKKHYASEGVSQSPEMEEGAWYHQCFSTGPRLTQKQQRSLLCQVRAGDTASEDLVVRAYLPLVARVAKGYLGRGLPLADLLQEGAIGLIKAIRSYDPAASHVPFRVFANRRIRWAMHAATRTSKQWLKVPSELREQINSVNSSTFQLFQEYGVAVLDETTAQQAGLSEEDIARLDIVTEPPLSLDQDCAGRGDDWEESDMLLRDQLAGPSVVEEDVLQKEQHEVLVSAVWDLPAKERFVLIERFGLLGRKASTLEAVGHSLGVTRERIRQREHKALRLLRSGGRRGSAQYRPAIHALHQLQRAERSSL